MVAQLEHHPHVVENGRIGDVDVVIEPEETGSGSRDVDRLDARKHRRSGAGFFTGYQS